MDHGNNQLAAAGESADLGLDPEVAHRENLRRSREARGGRIDARQTGD